MRPEFARPPSPYLAGRTSSTLLLVWNPKIERAIASLRQCYIVPPIDSPTPAAHKFLRPFEGGNASDHPGHDSPWSIDLLCLRRDSSGPIAPRCMGRRNRAGTPRGSNSSFSLGSVRHSGWRGLDRKARDQTTVECGGRGKECNSEFAWPPTSCCRLPRHLGFRRARGPEPPRRVGSRRVQASQGNWLSSRLGCPSPYPELCRQYRSLPEYCSLTMSTNWTVYTASGDSSCSCGTARV